MASLIGSVLVVVNVGAMVLLDASFAELFTVLLGVETLQGLKDGHGPGKAADLEVLVLLQSPE